ncbi:1-acylglycerol-3-phosphate O-acyltransferase SLC1 NDAI_0D04480 [Naumovozyma dairenensis CBS 421]|uniref:1-acyl-sn-glycerol-3-phosphate acyltransferase n=1 Tax=Naumovozyma dairenensis (strain ATCC 10597 / BCRC 20456 / CBS 421 / NBRC 0211 / NRRL Y-12639) TaxID=1071378 RepID=G0WAF1_NAUDC|nr:hypothetical protein NDAI_0D04480 [Naumovozyma dairenensis CBS 421]CCD24762.1 hypothetical protein NDAI_0D04480 [Naumovozyma dairenensis CBS 421]
MGSNIVYYLRSTLGIFVLIICAIYGVIASIVCTLIGKQHLAQYLTARCYSNAMKYIMNIDVKVIDEENLKNLPFIVVSNHQSMLDILMLGKLFPPGCTITAKKSLKYVPFLGWFMALSGTLFLDRSNRTKSVTTLHNGLTKIRNNKRAIWIFPEGTRSHTTDLEMLPFKKGAFHLAQQGKLPIVPVVVANTSTIKSSKWKVYNTGCMVVKVLKPLSTEGLQKDDIPAFSEKVRDLMDKELKELGYCPANNITNLPPNVLEAQKKNL